MFRGFSVRGVYVLGVSVRGVHVRGGEGLCPITIKNLNGNKTCKKTTFYTERGQNSFCKMSAMIINCVPEPLVLLTCRKIELGISRNFQLL